MRACRFTVIFLSLIVISSYGADAGNREIAAKKCAQEWLALADAGRFADSWNSAGAYLKRAVSQGAWLGKLDTMRKPLGKVVSRKLENAKPGKDFNGVPGGDYFQLRFATSFSNQKQAVETVTSVLQQDGNWKVCGYYIQ